jgi:hypothetical protein
VISGCLISFTVQANSDQGLFSKENLQAIKNDPTVIYSKVNACRLKSMLGAKDYAVLNKSMDRLATDDDAAGYVSVSGAVSGLYTIMEGFIRLSDSGKVWIAYLKDNKVYYFTNDKAALKQPPTIMQKWSSRFNDAKWIDKHITIKPDTCKN